MRLNVTKRMRISFISFLIHGDPSTLLAFTNKTKKWFFNSFYLQLQLTLYIVNGLLLLNHNTANDFERKADFKCRIKLSYIR